MLLTLPSKLHLLFIGGRTLKWNRSYGLDLLPAWHRQPLVWTLAAAVIMAPSLTGICHWVLGPINATRGTLGHLENIGREESMEYCFLHLSSTFRIFEYASGTPQAYMYSRVYASSWADLPARPYQAPLGMRQGGHWIWNGSEDGMEMPRATSKWACVASTQ